MNDTLIYNEKRAFLSAVRDESVSTSPDKTTLAGRMFWRPVERLEQACWDAAEVRRPTIEDYDAEMSKWRMPKLRSEYTLYFGRPPRTMTKAQLVMELSDRMVIRDSRLLTYP